MATSFEPDTVGLTSQSSGRSLEDSFEYIDGVFDEAFNQELSGKVTADYIPLDKGEIFLRRGRWIYQSASLTALAYLKRKTRYALSRPVLILLRRELV